MNDMHINLSTQLGQKLGVMPITQCLRRLAWRSTKYKAYVNSRHCEKLCRPFGWNSQM